MFTVIDHASPWLIPSRTFAATIHHQLGAHMTRSGTGTPKSHPATSTRLRPNRSPNCPAKKLVSAFTMPNVAMKESAAVLEARPKSRSAMSGRTVRSRPTIAPTNAFTSTRSQNCRQFARRPNTGGSAPRAPGVERRRPTTMVTR